MRRLRKYLEEQDIINRTRELISGIGIILLFTFIVIFHIVRFFFISSPVRSVLPPEDLILIEEALGESLLEPELGYYN